MKTRSFFHACITVLLAGQARFLQGDSGPAMLFSEAPPAAAGPARRGVLCFWLVFLLLSGADILLSRLYIRAGMKRRKRRGETLRLSDLKPLFLLQPLLLVLVLATSLLAGQAAVAGGLRPAEAAPGSESARADGDAEKGRSGGILPGELVQKMNIILRRGADGRSAEGSAESGPAPPVPPPYPGQGVGISQSDSRAQGGWGVPPPEAGAGEARVRPAEPWVARLWERAAGQMRSRLYAPKKPGADAAAAVEAMPEPVQRPPGRDPRDSDRAPPPRVDGFEGAAALASAVTSAALPAPAPAASSRAVAGAPKPEAVRRPTLLPPAAAAPSEAGAAAGARVERAALPERWAEPELPERGGLVTVAPGAVPDFFAADVLFVHAHPDDESLDFGALMARSSDAGLDVVTVLFTDGEGGNDRYPGRRVDGEYPDHRLRGEELAARRVAEARRALSLLGCRVYVRLGLPNHPYNSLLDRMPVQKVIASWGGEEELVKRLAAIIRGFEPRVVVGPDSHSAAHEHFEHEAVGVILRRTLEKLAAEGGPQPRGVLLCVDPRQKSRYRDLTAISASEIGGQGRSYREIQLQALEQHVSQLDAALGAEFLPRYPEEYYLPLRWDAELPLPAVPY